MMRLFRKQRSTACSFEPLESRQMFSVVNVTPANFMAAIHASGSGDTINFAPGEYDIKSSTVQLAGDRAYVGNGAVLKGSGSVVISFDHTLNVDFSGFLLDGTGVRADYSDGLNFHGNTITNTSIDGFSTTSMINSHVDNNTFTAMGGGIYGYPLGANTIDGNTFDYVQEPIHFYCHQLAQGMDVSGNTMTHITRFGIELQGCIDSLTVNNNFMSDWLQQGTGQQDSHMAISCATGGGGHAPYTDQAQNVTISGNVLIQNGPAQNLGLWAKSAIEIMGYSNLNITGNYCWNWGNLVLNGAYGTVNSSENIEVGGNLYAPDGVTWKIGQVTGSGDHRYALGDPAAPPWRGAPAETAASAVPSSDTVRPPKHANAAKPKPTAKKPASKTKAASPVTRTIHSVTRTIHSVLDA